MTVREPLRLGWSLGGSARLFYWNEPSTPSFSMLSKATMDEDKTHANLSSLKTRKEPLGRPMLFPNSVAQNNRSNRTKVRKVS
jgi:hypothetical protein